MFSVQTIKPLELSYSRTVEITCTANTSSEKSITFDSNTGLVVDHIGIALFASDGTNLNAITESNKDRDSFKIYVKRATGNALMGEPVDLFEFAKRFENHLQGDKLFLPGGTQLTIQITHSNDGLTSNQASNIKCEVSFHGYTTDAKNYEEYLIKCANTARTISQKLSGK